MNSNLAEQIDFKGQTITFTYDNLNRLETKNYSTGEPQVVYEYDTAVNGVGQLYSISNTLVTSIINQYDPMGRAKSATKFIQGGQPEGYTTTSNYDLAGRIKNITYPDQTPENDTDNLKLTYTFIPETSLVGSVTGSDGTVYGTAFNYHPTGKIGQITYANNTQTVYSYNDLTTRLDSMFTSAPQNGPDIQNYTYQYSPAGDITQIANNSVTSNVTYKYTYDKLHRLIDEQQTGAPAGSNADQLNYEYENDDHVHAISGIRIGGNSYSYSYDLNGNMLAGPDLTNLASPESRTITYNADNMPTRIEHTNGTEVDILYDGAGVRAKKTVDGTDETYYINTNYQIKNGSDIYYVFLGSLRIAEIKDGAIKFYHKDHLGSTTATSDRDGILKESTKYNPFGTTRAGSDITETDYKFTDQEFDQGTGLYNYNARLYDPVLGRFISADSATPGGGFDPQYLDRYAYCRNNPLIYTDPSGHYPDSGLDPTGDSMEKNPYSENYGHHKEDSIAEWTEKYNSDPCPAVSKGTLSQYIIRSKLRQLDPGMSIDNIQNILELIDWMDPTSLADYLNSLIDIKRGNPEYAALRHVVGVPLMLGVASKNIIKISKKMQETSRIIAQGKRIREVNKLVEEFGGKAKNWIKKSSIDDLGREIHWYEHRGIGKVKRKIVD